MKHVVVGVALVLFGLGSCGDSHTSQPDTSVDTPPNVDPALLTIDHGANPFGSVGVGMTSAPATFTITNTGDQASGAPTASLAGPDAGEFQLANSCTTALVANATCTVTVTFAPTSAGAKTATLSVGATPGGTVTAALSGTGLAPGALAVSVSSNALGSVVVGATGATTALVTVTNNGDTETGALSLQAAGSDPVDFTTSDDTCSTHTLAGHAACTFRIAFAPRSPGVKTSEFRIAALPGGSVDAAVSGTGLAPAHLVALPLQQGFGSVIVGSVSSEVAVTVTNTGDIASSTLGLAITGIDAAMYSSLASGTCTGTLAAHASCEVHLTFTPASTGAKQALLAISGGDTANVILGRIGIPSGQLSITPTVHAFGNVNMNATASAQELTITNAGVATTGVLSTTLTGAGFQIVAGTDACTGVSLPAAGSCTVSVAFAPTTGGPAAAQLVVAGAPGGTVMSALSGVGIGPAQLAISPASRAFGAVAIGDVSAPLVFTVTNLGGQASSVPTATLAGADSTQFQLSTSCTVALSPGGTCTVTIAFAPTHGATSTATVEVSAVTGGTVSASVTGLGNAPDGLVFVPAALPFPPLAVGETTDQTLTLVNAGAIDTTEVFLTTNDAELAIVGPPCPALAAGASCAITVRFAPTTAGARTASLDAGAAIGGSTTAALLATVKPRLEIIAIDGGPVASPHDLGTAIVNNTTPHDALITVRNNTATAQPFSLTSMFSGQFQVISNTCDATDTIASAGTCTVGVRFAPTSTGAKSGSLTFAIGTGPTNQATQQLSGTAIEALVLTPLGGTAFGTVPINTQSPALRFRVTNPTGSVTSGTLSTTLTGTSMAITADACTGQQLAAAASCDIDVRFAPTAAANVTGELVVTGMPGGAPSVTLTANGIEPVGQAPTAITLTPGTIAENSPSGTSVGTLATVDADLGQSYTYAFVDGIGADNNSAFTLVGDQVRTNGVFDFETKASYTIRIRTTDSGGYSFEQALTIDVTNIDELPTAVNDAATVAEDSAATTIDVRTNDTDIDAGPKTIVTVTQPANGQVAITNGGTDLTYQPNANFAGTDTFTYTLNGGSLATVTITVTPVDDAPVAVNDTATVLEDSGTTALDVRGNDTDIDGGPLTITAITQPAAGQGTVAITGGGTGVSYTTASNFAGTTTFTYTLNGGSTATVTVTVTAVDDPPTAVDDAFTVAEDSAATTLDVLANDTDIDGGSAPAIQSVSQPTNGTVVLVGATTVTYRPNANFSSVAPDTFTYTLVGGSTATVRVTVTNIDDPPVAVDDTATVTEDAGATAIPVLTNDTDIDGGTKSINAVTQPAHGTVVITGGGSGLTYAPAANYCNAPPSTALDTFTYTLNGNDTATVTVTVTCVNDAPTAVMLAPGTIAENAATGTPAGTLTSIDVDSTTFTYALVAGSGSANNASFTIVGNELRSTASFDVEATPTLAIRVRTTDADGAFFEQALVVTVTNVNEAPTDFTPATNTLSVPENQPVGTAITTLAGIDPDAGDAFVYTLVGGTGSTDNARFAIDGNTLRVAQVQDYEESATKTRTVRIRVTDAGGLFVERALQFALTNVDEAPTAIALSNTAFAESLAVGGSIGTFSATDPEGGAMTYTLVTGTGDTDNAKFAIVGTQLSTAQGFDFEGGVTTFSIRVRVQDASNMTFERTFTLTVTDVNEPPVDGDELVPAQAHVGLVVGAPGLLANATDPDAGNTVTAAAGTFVTTQGGKLTIAANGAYTYLAPAGKSNVADSYTYTVHDASGATNLSTITFSLDSNPIWFVDLAAAVNGDGTLGAPANKLPSGFFTGDGAIFVYTSDTSTANSTETGVFEIRANQQLLGEGLVGVPGATINTYLGFTTYPGSPPLPAINGPRHTIARYLSISGVNSAVRDLDVGGLAASDFGTLTVDHVAIRNATTTSSSTNPLTLRNGTAAITLDALSGQVTKGIALSNVDGTITVASGLFEVSTGNVLETSGGGVALTYNGVLSATGTSTGLSFTNTTGPYTFATVTLGKGGIAATGARGKITVANGLVANGGLSVGGASGGIDFTGPLTKATAGPVVNVQGATGTAPITLNGNVTYDGTGTAILIANSSVPVVFDGTSKRLRGDVVLSTNSGEVRFRNGGLEITNGQLSASAQTGPLEVSGAQNTIDANAAALSLSNTVIAAQGVSFATAMSSTPGIQLATTSGGPIVIGAGSSAGATGYAASLNGIDNDVTIGMALSAGVSVTGVQTGRTISFLGPITSSTTGIELDANNAANIAFTGGLDISSSVPFRVQNGGVITVTGAANRLTGTSTAPALELVNTTIGSGNVRFQSINSASSGINLSSVGSAGGLLVTGTGAANTGGSVRSVRIIGGVGHVLSYMNIDADNVSETALMAINVQGLQVKNCALDGFKGVDATGTTGLQLVSSTVVGTSDAITLLRPLGTGGNGNTLASTSVTSTSGSALVVTSTTSTNAPILPTSYGFAQTFDRPGRDALSITGTSSFTTASTSVPAISINAAGASNLYVRIVTATLTGGRGLRAVNHSPTLAVLDLDLTNSNINGAQSQGVYLEGGDGTLFWIANNSITVASSAYGMYAASPYGHARGQILGNVIMGAGSGSPTGIDLSGSMTLTLDNDTIGQFNVGVHFSGPERIYATVSNMTVTASATGLNMSTFGPVSVCVNLISNIFNGAGLADYAIFQSDGGVVQLQGFTGNGTDPTTVKNFIQSRERATATFFGSGLNVTPGACPLP